jgi:hypothetical protein
VTSSARGAPEPISPELALVDPELAERAREWLPEPAQPPPRAPEQPAPSPAPVRTRRRRVRFAFAAALAALAGVAAGAVLRQADEPGPVLAPLSVRAAGSAAPQPEPTTTAAEPAPAPATTPTVPPTITAARQPAATTPATTTAPRAPRAAATATTPTGPAPGTFQPARTFAWPPAPNAAYYRVVFRRGGEVEYAAFTNRPRLVLPEGFRWRPGDYTWIVFPGFGARSERRLGDSIVRAGFTIPPG